MQASNNTSGNTVVLGIFLPVQFIVFLINWLTAIAEAVAGDHSSHTNEWMFEAVREAHPDGHV